MSEFAVKVEGLGKKFNIGHQRSKDLRSSLSSKFQRIFRGRTEDSEFWALKDVSLTIKPGDAVGIIGRNGAGKSTLLKILSRITSPTTGKIMTTGRVSSLLEVGTGFHPELTGRENVFLNGTILGMKRHEIKAKFDEIVEFSGVEKFLETPLKHYSSGMQMRLAFSVAAFLEPEILIIDEVLAVGDAEFQKKCLGKMEDVSRSGRTILFVSHNMMLVESLCEKSILLHHGQVYSEGLSNKVVQDYMNIGVELHNQTLNLSNAIRKQGNGNVLFQQIGLSSSSGIIKVGQEIEFDIVLANQGSEIGRSIFVAITIFNQHGVKLTTLDNLYSNQELKMQSGNFSLSCRVPELQLTPGQYRADLWCADMYDTYDLIENAYSFTVEAADVFGTGKIHSESKHGNWIVENYWANL